MFWAVETSGVRAVTATISGWKLLQRGFQIAVQPHIEDAHLMLGNRRGDHLQMQRFRRGHQAKSDALRQIGLNQQNSHNRTSTTWSQS